MFFSCKFTIKLNVGKHSASIQINLKLKIPVKNLFNTYIYTTSRYFFVRGKGISRPTGTRFQRHISTSPH